MTQAPGFPTFVSRCLDSVEEERELLVRLATAARSSRAVPAGRAGQPELERLLDEQAELCIALERCRMARGGWLAEAGHAARDLLMVLLGQSPREGHSELVERFKRHADAAEAAQREIDVNREFFGVALASLEEVVEAVAGVGRAEVYDERGSSASDARAICLSTVT